MNPEDLIHMIQGILRNRQDIKAMTQRDSMNAKIPGQPPIQEYMQNNRGLRQLPKVIPSDDPLVALEQAQMRGEWM